MAEKKLDLKKLRESSISDLKEKEKSLRKQLMELRFKHANRQLKNIIQLRTVRRDIARVMGIITTKEGELSRGK